MFPAEYPFHSALCAAAMQEKPGIHQENSHHVPSNAISLPDAATNIAKIAEGKNMPAPQGTQNTLSAEKSNLTADNSDEAAALRAMGVRNVQLQECHPMYRKEVLAAIQSMCNQYPELQAQLHTVTCFEFGTSSALASYAPTQRDEIFGGVLKLNAAYFRESSLPEKLNELGKEGHFIPNSDVQSLIKHELGHGLELNLCAVANHAEYGKQLPEITYNTIAMEYGQKKIAGRIVDSACRDCGISFNRQNLAPLLSAYGAENKSEAFAEGISEVNTSPNPRPLAVAISKRFLEFQNHANEAGFPNLPFPKAT